MDIFSTQPGSVSAVRSPGTSMSLFVDGWLGYAPMKAIIQGFSIHTKSGVQFMHSLRDFIYVYVFGERIAPVRIHGLSFAHVCERLDEVVHGAAGRTAFRPSLHGLENVMGYYNIFRVSSRGAPVTLVFGLNTVLAGFLTDCSIELQDTEKQLATFSLEFQCIPKSTVQDILLGV